MSEYRTAHARWASKEVGKAEWGAVGAMLDDERRIRALEAAIERALNAWENGDTETVIFGPLEDALLQRPDGQRKETRDE